MWRDLTSGIRSTQSCSSSPGMRRTRTLPLALTVAHLTAAVVKLAISPTNCPSLRTATRYSRGPRDRVDVNSLALLAPCGTPPLSVPKSYLVKGRAQQLHTFLPPCHACFQHTSRTRTSPQKSRKRATAVVACLQQCRGESAERVRPRQTAHSCRHSCHSCRKCPNFKTRLANQGLRDCLKPPAKSPRRRHLQAVPVQA